MGPKENLYCEGNVAQASACANVLSSADMITPASGRRRWQRVRLAKFKRPAQAEACATKSAKIFFAARRTSTRQAPWRALKSA